MESIFGEFNPLLLMVFILALVEAVKKFGVSGNRLTIASIAIGAGLGMLYQVGVMFPVILPWLSVLVYGGLTGLAASGLYDLGKKYLPGGQR